VEKYAVFPRIQELEVIHSPTLSLPRDSLAASVEVRRRTPASVNTIPLLGSAPEVFWKFDGKYCSGTTTALSKLSRSVH